jgi:hypothetical protein
MKNLRKEVNDCLAGKGGDFIGLLDILYCTAFNVTIDEIESLCERATDAELDIINEGLGSLDDTSTFTQKRRALEIRNKYVKYYNI